MKLAMFAILTCVAGAANPCLVVDRSSVTAGDLATVIPEFLTISASRHIVWAPAPGLTRWLRAPELRTIAARDAVAVAADTSVCLQRRTVVFSEEQIIVALRERLPQGAAIRIVDFCRLPTMSGRLRFGARPAVLPTGDGQTLLWKGAVVDDDRRTATFWASFQVRITRRVVRAARLIPAKAILTQEDLVEEIEESGVVDAHPTPDLSGLLGKEAGRRIAPRQLIDPRWLRTPQLISKGQTVRVVVESGQALLGLDARALTSGNRGDTLLFLNDGGGKKFRAEVTGPGKAVVRMEDLRR